MEQEDAFVELIDGLFSGVCKQFNISSFKESMEKFETQEKIRRVNEYKSFEIIKKILKSEINTQRLHLNMARNHCSVLLDKKVSQTICRLYVLKPKCMYITIRHCSEQVQYDKFLIDELNDIYSYDNILKDALHFFLQKYLAAPAV